MTNSRNRGGAAGRPKKPVRQKKITGIECVWSATRRAWCWRARRNWTVAGKRVVRVGPPRLTQQSAHADYLALDQDAAPVPGGLDTLGEALDLVRKSMEDDGIPETSITSLVDGHGGQLLAFWPRETVLADIDGPSVKRFVVRAKAEGRSATTLSDKDLPLLTRCFRALGLVSPVPDVVKVLKRSLLKKEKPVMQFFTTDELREIFERMRARPLRNRQGHLVQLDEAEATFHADLVQLLALTGLRAGGELERLTLGSIRHGVITVQSKDRGNVRTIAVDELLLPVIERLEARARATVKPTTPRDQVPLIARCKGTVQRCWRIWRKILNEPRLCGRTLRHSSVTAVLSTHGTSLDAMEHAGHKSLRTTDRYVHALSSRPADRRKRVAQAMGLVAADAPPSPAVAPAPPSDDAARPAPG